VIAPFVVGAAWAYALGFPLAKSAFVAAAFVATSAGITARVLQDLGVLGRIESRVILGAAVIDDILAMLLLGVVTAIQAEGKVELVSLAFVFLQALGFVTLIALVGTKIMERRSALLDAPINPLSPLTISLALCLGLAAFASYIGLAAIIGAFLAGMVVAESRQRLALEKQVHVLMVFLVPFFFVMTGTQVELSALATWNALFMLLVATTLAVASKFIGCGLGARSLGVRSAAIVGIGMAPRGEVGIIVASLGKQAGVFSGEIYAVLIGMSLLTSVVAPPALKALFGADRNSPATEPMEGHLRNVDEAGYSG
jgi:Kef-type K+ transport system membrane component KefB